MHELQLFVFYGSMYMYIIIAINYMSHFLKYHGTITKINK